MAEIAAPRPRPLPARAGRDWIIARSALLAPLGLFLLALVARVLIIWPSAFDGLYGQDAYAYYDYSRQMLTALSRAQLPPPFWWPLGYPALLSLGFLILGASVRTAQLVTLVTGAAVAPLTYLLTREALRGKGGQVAGLVAGSTVALGGQAVQSSVVIMADAPALMWATLSAGLLLRYRRSGGACALALSGVAQALAVITRWEMVGLTPVWLAAGIVSSLTLASRGDGPGLRSLLEAGRRVLPALLLAAIVLLPQAAYKLAYSQPLAGQSWIEGWNPANFLARSFDNVDGHFDYALPVAPFYAQVSFHPAYLFPFLTPFLVLGAWLLLRRVRREPHIFVLLAGWVAVMYLFLAGIPYENFRFGLGYLAPVAVMAGLGVASVWEHSQRLRLGLGGLVVISLVGLALWEARVLQPILAEKRSELGAVHLLGRILPDGARVFTFGVTAALNTYSGLRVTDLSEESPQGITAAVRANSPAYLFVDVTNIETQWHGRELEQTFLVLRDRVGLQEIGKSDNWTLFRIGAAP